MELRENDGVSVVVPVPGTFWSPTGRCETGFFPIIGLHRPGIDTSWAFTWVDKATKLQFNGAAGITFNFENTATDYQSGDEFHFEWAIGEAPFAWGFFF